MMQLFFKHGKVAQGPVTETTSLAKQNTNRGPESTSSDRESWWRWRRRRFSAIGWGYVILMVLIFSLSSAWSLLLIILNLEPSKSANYILQTESLDNGHFWQSSKADSSILATCASLLLVVIGVYWYLLYLLLVRSSSRRIQAEEHKPKPRKLVLRKIRTVEEIVEQQKQLMKRPALLMTRQVVRMAVKIYRSVVSTDGKHRKAWNVLMEIPEVILQILSLREHMAQGLDSSLLYCYASLMALNAFVAFYDIQFRWNDSTLHHILKDSIVDAAFAVFFPALILFYSFSVFQDDLKTVKIRQKFFPPRVFERKARNYVSAKELNMFSTDFESILMRSAWDIFLKLSFNLLACFRWSKITRLLLQREHMGPLSPHPAVTTPPKPVNLATNTSTKCEAVAPLDNIGGSARQNTGARQTNTRLKSRLRNLVGFLFLLYGVGCIVYTVNSIRVSQAACMSYPTCVQFAYQWVPGAANDVCACLAHVDREMAPADSDNLTDVTQTLAELASAGKLQTVQLVNRKINGSLPEELEACQGLRNIVLIHTGVEEFPSWASTTFTQLEYLHVEGDSADTNLVQLPSDLFSSMSSLHTIYLSFHANLPSLPSLDGLKTLQSVYFGYLDCISEIPLMGNHPALEVLALEGLPLVRSLPDVAAYENSLDMIFLQDTPACCSGFLSEGDCNTTFPSCCSSDKSNGNSEDDHGSDGSRHDPLPPTCLLVPDEDALLPTNTTLSIFTQFAANISNFCDAAQATCSNAIMAEKHRVNDTCEGVLYRECFSESEGVGICFSENMGRVECTYSQGTIDMRVAEIAAGCSCDSVEEAWLGCE